MCESTLVLSTPTPPQLEMASVPASLRILVFGTAGKGKSSLINALIGTELATVGTSARATGCTFEPTTATGTLAGTTCAVEVVEAVGLTEIDASAGSSKKTFLALTALLEKCKEGVNLAIYVRDKSRILEDDEANYGMFVKTLCQNTIPVICIVTHCEDNLNLSDWPAANSTEFTRRGFLFADMRGTCFGKGGRFESVFAALRAESTQSVVNSVLRHALPQPCVFLGDAHSVNNALRAVWNSFCDFAARATPSMSAFRMP